MAIVMASRPAQFDRATQHRRAMIAKINIARQQLGMVEDDYRQLLLDTTGRMSLKECSDAQLDRMIGALKQKGFKPLPPKGGATHPMARKARAMWISLYHLGAVHNPSEQALEAFARRQLGCDRLAFAKQSDAFRLVEALKAMAERNGWPQQAHSLTALQEALCHAILAKLKAAGEVPGDWALHVAAWRLCGIENAKSRPWNSSDYDNLAAGLGAKLRAAKGEAA